MEQQPTYIVASERPWNAQLASRLGMRTGSRFIAITRAADLTAQSVAEAQPRYIFFAHWSARIPEAIWSAHECVVFHMTDVPYGRGGSPLQNLIARGHDTTMMSALRCERGLDAGPVYLKRPLALHGSAEEIFLRADRVIESMIVEMIRDEPAPSPQQGEVVTFTRRRPEEGDLRAASGLDQWYDLIRMLDAEGYPHAYLDVGALRLEFSRVNRRSGGLVANVVIRERPTEGGT
jgi:methionyl-tRNA formyltransferase